MNVMSFGLQSNQILHINHAINIGSQILNFTHINLLTLLFDIKREGDELHNNYVLSSLSHVGIGCIVITRQSLHFYSLK